jgi:hypothetical protein
VPGIDSVGAGLLAKAHTLVTSDVSHKDCGVTGIRGSHNLGRSELAREGVESANITIG